MFFNKEEYTMEALNVDTKKSEKKGFCGNCWERFLSLFN